MNRWQQWLAWVDERSLRERLLLFAAAAALLIYPFLVQVEALNQEEVQLQEALRAQQTQLAVSRAQSAQLMRELSHDPAEELQQRLQHLREKGEALQRKVARYQQTLVASEEMVAVLRDLLKDFPGLRVVALKSVPVMPLAGDHQPQQEGEGTASAGQQGEVLLYRRGIELELEGEYLTLLAYVEALEKGRWRFLWGPARFAVVDHPRVRLKMTLYTLSTDQGWLQV